MSNFIYETHLHTKEVSPCATAPASDVVKCYVEAGYDGIIITDHFICNKEPSISADEWKKKIDHLCSGYEAALEEGKKHGLKVFLGWEYAHAASIGTDLLTYGLDKEWLLKHPEIYNMSASEYCKFVRSEGGFISQAHPFRESWYIEMIRLMPKNVDAVEIVNSNRTDFENERALEYSKNYGLLRTIGSDNHDGSRKSRLVGMSFDAPLNNINDFIDAVKSKKAVMYDVVR